MAETVGADEEQTESVRVVGDVHEEAGSDRLGRQRG